MKKFFIIGLVCILIVSSLTGCIGIRRKGSIQNTTSTFPETTARTIYPQVTRPESEVPANPDESIIDETTQETTPETTITNPTTVKPTPTTKPTAKPTSKPTPKPTVAPELVIHKTINEPGNKKNLPAGSSAAGWGIEINGKTYSVGYFIVNSPVSFTVIDGFWIDGSVSASNQVFNGYKQVDTSPTPTTTQTGIEPDH